MALRYRSRVWRAMPSRVSTQGITYPSDQSRRDDMTQPWVSTQGHRVAAVGSWSTSGMSLAISLRESGRAMPSRVSTQGITRPGDQSRRDDMTQPWVSTQGTCILFAPSDAFYNQNWSPGLRGFPPIGLCINTRLPTL